MDSDSPPGGEGPLDQNLSYTIHRSLADYDSGTTSFAGSYLLCSKRGTLRLEAAGRLWWLPPERAAWIPPGHPVRIVAEGPVETASVAFSQLWTSAPLTACSVFHLSPVAREMIHFSTRWDRPQRPDAERSERFFGTLADLCRDLAQQPIALWLPLPSSETLGRACGHIGRHLDKPLDSDSVAEVAHTTARTLARHFRQELSMSLGEYVQKARILRAMELLGRTDKTVTEIVYSVGLASPGSFEVAFKRLVQMTPTQYRRSLAGPRVFGA